MKTLTTSMMLSVIFLTAGAFAGGRHDVQPWPAPRAGIENVTVVSKNRIWPPAGQISVEPCNLRRCLEV